MNVERVRELVRELQREVGLDTPVVKKKPARTEYVPAPNGGTFQIDYDEDDVEVHRELLPHRVLTRGMVTTGDAQPQEDTDE